MLLLFLFGGKKKKVTKRKTAVCSFKAAARLRPAEAQELASLKQPALLFAVLRFSAFRLETEDGIFSLACSSLFALWAKSLCGEMGLLLAFLFLASLFALAFLLGEIAVWGGGAFACASVPCFAFCFGLPFGRNRCVGRWSFCLRFFAFLLRFLLWPSFWAKSLWRRSVEFGSAFFYSFILCCKDETSLRTKVRASLR